MRWSFRWRKELKTGQYYDLLNRGFIKPENQEPCLEGFEFYLDAFRELSTSRPVVMEIQSIPFTAIAEYFRIYELRDFEDFSYIIRQMDMTFIEMNTENKDREDKNAARKPDTEHKDKR